MPTVFLTPEQCQALGIPANSSAVMTYFVKETPPELKAVKENDWKKLYDLTKDVTREELARALVLASMCSSNWLIDTAVFTHDDHPNLRETSFEDLFEKNWRDFHESLGCIEYD